MQSLTRPFTMSSCECFASSSTISSFSPAFANSMSSCFTSSLYFFSCSFEYKLTPAARSSSSCFSVAASPIASRPAPPLVAKVAKPRRRAAGLRGRPGKRRLLVLFPSWLSHSVTRLADSAAGERIAVAFNVHGAEV